METIQLNVLIAGIDGALNESLAECVRNRGGNLIGVFTNGIEALKCAKNPYPGIVIADINLYGVDGLGFVQGVKRAMPRSLCLVTSDSPSDSAQRLAFEYGADYVAVRPVDPAALVETVFGVALASPDIVTPDFIRAPNPKILSAALSLDDYTTLLLNKMRMPVAERGYHYIKDAITLAVEDAARLQNLHTNIYNRVADKNNTTPAKVELYVRAAIEAAWEQGDIVGVLGEFHKGKPNIREFLAGLADKVYIECKVRQM